MVRFIEFANRPERYPWSLRQYAVYYKFCTNSPGLPSSTWILFGSSTRSERCFDSLFSAPAESHKGAPFEIHVDLLDVAISSWRPYLIRLHDTIADLVSLIKSDPRAKADHVPIREGVLDGVRNRRLFHKIMHR
jgi:hypothetical protein